MLLLIKVVVVVVQPVLNMYDGREKRYEKWSRGQNADGQIDPRSTIPILCSEHTNANANINMHD